MTNKLNRVAFCLLAGLYTQAVVLGGTMEPASANESVTHAADANAPADASGETARAATKKPASASAKGPYYVDFRARTAASWGHAFVWYGKSSERAVEVAGLLQPDQRRACDGSGAEGPVPAGGNRSQARPADRACCPGGDAAGAGGRCQRCRAEQLTGSITWQS